MKNKTRMETFTFRLDNELMETIRRVARTKSFNSGVDVSAGDLVRSMLEFAAAASTILCVPVVKGASE